MRQGRISAAATARLNREQAAINAVVGFAAQASYAKDAWEDRTNNADFTEIYNELVSMCVHNKVCNYCECTEATDIEHVLPKSLFPGNAFVWENYILVCKTCNTEYKLDKMSVFRPAGSATLYPVPRGTEPPTQDAAIINIRIENPECFIELDLDEGIFSERQPVGTVGFEKAKFTIDEALMLNTRADLRSDRKYTYKELYKYLSYAVKVYEAQNFDALEEAINDNAPHILVNRTRLFDNEKQKFLNSICKAIQEHKHPTVWKEMKKQRTLYPRLDDLFLRFTEASEW